MPKKTPSKNDEIETKKQRKCSLMTKKTRINYTKKCPHLTFQAKLHRIFGQNALYFGRKCDVIWPEMKCNLGHIARGLIVI